MGVEEAHSRTAAEEVASALDEIESRLLTVIREGAHTVRPLDETIADLAQLIVGIRPQFERLQALFTPRDLTFDFTLRLEDLRRRLLWLYRRIRLEHIFFAKLQLERLLRDALYRQVLETYDEFSELDRKERVLRSLPEEDLATDLQGLPQPN